jgi:hypothetical protein
MVGQFPHGLHVATLYKAVQRACVGHPELTNQPDGTNKFRRGIEEKKKLTYHNIPDEAIFIPEDNKL